MSRGRSGTQFMNTLPRSLGIYAFHLGVYFSVHIKLWQYSRLSNTVAKLPRLLPKRKGRAWQSGNLYINVHDFIATL